jgi:hypothetical protein
MTRVKCAASLIVGTSEGSLIRSSDHDDSWIRADTGFTDTATAFAVKGGYLFAGTASGMFHSQDNGNSWKRISEKLEGFQIDAVAVSGGDLFGGTAGAGVWRRPLSEFSTSILPFGNSRRESGIGPARLVYVEGKIALTLSQRGRVKLVAHDVQGRNTSALVNQVLEKGTHRIPLASTRTR